jgi:hypothetical protein
MTASDDAQEFGSRRGSWYVCMLVARSVAVSPGRISNTILLPKVNATEFARMAGASVQRVLNYMRTWDDAASRGVVPPSAEMSPGQDVDLSGLPPWAVLPNAGEAHRGTIARDHTVYVHLAADGTVLYVGVSFELLRRIRRHQVHIWWPQVATIRVEHYPDRASTFLRESQLIAELNPIYNS